MTLLWPAAWAFLALAIPIVAFYLLRQRLRRQSVTTLLFWDASQRQVQQKPLWRQLRRFLSLLLQLLLLILLTLALSRPIFPGQRTVATSHIFILDPSVTMKTHSTGDETRWSEAVTEVQRRINLMGFGDEAMLLLSGTQPRLLCAWTGRKSTLTEALKSAQPLAEPTDIRPTLRLLDNLLLSHPGAIPELFSDTVWTVAPDANIKSVYLNQVIPAPPNSGITLLSARPLPSAPGEYQLVVHLEQNTDAPVSGELEITQNGHILDVLQATIPPHQPWQKTWREESTTDTTFQAAWHPQVPEKFTEDDTAVTQVPALHKLKVTWVSPENPFLQVALESLPLLESQRLTPLSTPDQIKATNADLYIFNHVLPPPDFLPDATLLIDPPDSGWWGRKVGAMDQPLVSDVDKEADIMRFVALDQIAFNDATVFTPAAGAKTYVNGFGGPIIFGHWPSSGDNKKWLVASFNLDESDFVLRTAFPIFCGNIIQSLRPQAIGTSQSIPGPIATELKPVWQDKRDLPEGAISYSNWAIMPLWWWVALALFVLLLLEWSLYTRRATE